MFPNELFAEITRQQISGYQADGSWVKSKTFRMSLATSRRRHWEQGLPSPDATVPSPGSRTPSPAAPDPRAGPSTRASQRFPSSCSYGSQINAAASHGAVFRITQAFKLTPRERGPVACWLRVPWEEGAAARSGGCRSPREGRPHGRRPSQVGRMSRLLFCRHGGPGS